MSERFRLRWPVDNHAITQYFGQNPEIYAAFNQAGHEGLDFVAPVGANIYACADGEVFSVRRPSDGNAYGLHVRIRHWVNNGEYHTIYAHLSEALVSVGQTVAAGDLIGLAGETGHTYGPHLHLTLKLIGALTPGYPAGVIDPLPYLRQDAIPQPGNLVIYTTDRVRLRDGTTTASAQLAWLGKGEALAVLGDADQARARVGQYGEWIQVQRADGMDGFVAAWYVELESAAPSPGTEPQGEIPGELVVYATEPLNVRNGPSTGTGRIAIALPDEPLEVVGDREAALAKLGDRGQWLRVRLPNDLRGYVAAWYVQTDPGQSVGDLLTVYPVVDMNFRERPTVSAGRIGRLERNTPLTVHDDPARARVLVGRYDEWLYVKSSQEQWGWVAAWYVSTSLV
jgi:uncharacterized protein YgiM (DUF1202 family)